MTFGLDVVGTGGVVVEEVVVVVVLVDGFEVVVVIGFWVVVVVEVPLGVAVEVVGFTVVDVEVVFCVVVGNGGIVVKFPCVGIGSTTKKYFKNLLI